MIVGDCVEVMRAEPADSVDAIVTDPPYGLEFMGKEWDKLRNRWEANPGTYHNDTTFLARGDRVRYRAGMESQVFHQTWATEALRVLKPGAHLLAFGGTRTYHRLVCALEDAGFEIRDTLAWMYGSGFPKSLDVSKAIDKRGGNSHLTAEIGRALRETRERHGMSLSEADRKFCGGTTNWSWFEGRAAGQRPPSPETFAVIVREWPELASLAEKVQEAERMRIGTSPHFAPGRREWAGPYVGGYGLDGTIDDRPLTAPATPAAQQWQGWGTALKPAFEPIVLARKPLSEKTVAANVQRWGTGALNIDGTRIGTDEDTARKRALVKDTAAPFGKGYEMGGNGSPAGRWPANVLLDEQAAALLDEQSGESQSKPGRVGRKGGNGGALGAFAGSTADAVGTWPADPGGGASRFFFVVPREDNDGQWSSDANTAAMSSAPSNESAASVPEAVRAEPSPEPRTHSPSMSGTASESKPSDGSNTPQTPSIEPRFSSGSQATRDTQTSDHAANAGQPGLIDITTITPSPSTSDGSAGGATSSTMPENEEAGASASGLRFTYTAKASRRERTGYSGPNDHPTVKPVALMRWLVKLITPPGGVVLDPFMGTGTTGIAAVSEGFGFVGIDQDAGYVSLAERRIHNEAGLFSVQEEVTTQEPTR